MGGAKKKSPAQQERSQSRDGATSKKSKGKDKDSKPKRAEITVTVTDAQAQGALKGMKSITAHDLAERIGVKISAANAYLVGAARAGTISVAGGYSGHWIYAPARSPAESKSTSPAETPESSPA